MPTYVMDAKEFSKLNGKCVAGKALITKTCGKFEQLCLEMDKMEEDTKKKGLSEGLSSRESR